MNPSPSFVRTAAVLSGRPIPHRRKSVKVVRHRFPGLTLSFEL
jgi:hypothetical protein